MFTTLHNQKLVTLAGIGALLTWASPDLIVWLAALPGWALFLLAWAAVSVPASIIIGKFIAHGQK